MSLIEIDENKLGMHSMLRCLAREIVHERFHDPGTGAGLYGPAIAQDRKKGKRVRWGEKVAFELHMSFDFLYLMGV